MSMDRLNVGYVARAHGVRGELRVHLHAADSTALDDARELTIGGRAFRVTGRRAVQGAWLLTVEGVADKDAADALAGQAVEVDRADIALDEGEFLVADLPGCQAFSPDGAALGRVHRVQHGPQDLLVLRDDDARVERLVPLVGEFLVEVDIAGKRIVLELPEGLPEDPF
jgi:16S rRNA processing protein RimM